MGTWCSQGGGVFAPTGRANESGFPYSRDGSGPVLLVDGIRYAQGGGASTRWLVVLVETPVEVFSAFLEASALSMPAYAELIRRFPIGLLLKHIFHYYTWSDYWGERALNWLGANGPLQAEFRGELEAFMSNKGMPQGAR